MGWLILGIIMFIIAYIALGIKITRDKYDDIKLKWGFSIKQAFSLIVLFIFILLGCIKTVPTGATGIVTTFGKIENISLDAGVHFMSPWKKVITMDNRTQKQTLEMSCFSSDIQEVSVSYTINYQINKANAQEIYRTIGKEYFDKIVQPKAVEAVKSVFARYNAEALIENRATLAKQIEEILTFDLEVYNIQVTSTSIENIDFTDSFTNAVEAKQVAEQNMLKAKTEQEQANLEAAAAAERQVIQAQADADAAIIAAQGDAEVAQIAADSAEYQGLKQSAIMNKIGEALDNHPDLIDYYKIDNWDGKLPTTMLDSAANLFINK